LHDAILAAEEEGPLQLSLVAESTQQICELIIGHLHENRAIQSKGMQSGETKKKKMEEDGRRRRKLVWGNGLSKAAARIHIHHYRN